MKKITMTVFAFFVGLGVFSQTTYSTGMVPLILSPNNYSGKVDVTNTMVTVTLVGPSTSWLGIAFDAPGLMFDTGKDVLIFDGTNMTDRSFIGQAEPQLDAQQNWTVTSNVVNAGVRTVTATRNRVATESTDYTFPFAAQPLQLTFARGLSLTVLFHGSGNCGSTMANFTLSTDSFDIKGSKIYPNPANDFVTIELPDSIYGADVLVFDMQGRKVKETTISLENNRVDLAGLNSGSYILNIKTENGQGSKIVVIN